jgi:hypothetical protein
MLVANTGAEQNAYTSYARRRRRITAMDGGSIPPISTKEGRCRVLLCQGAY